MSRSVQETPAEDTLTILEKIGKLKLTSTESALVSFLLSNSEMIASIQLNELAKQAYVSSATISRFVRKLGFKNYNDFRVAFVKERSGTAFPDMVVNYDNPLHLNMSTQDIENTIFSILEQTLKDVFVINDTASFEKASELIFNAKRIKIYGTSTYLSIANIFKLNMQRINKNVEVMHLEGEGVFSAYRATQDELSIVITYSGKSSLALAQVVSILSRSKSPLLLITSMHNKTYNLNDFASVLYIPSKQKGPIYFSSISVEMSIFAILYMLYACHYEKDYGLNMEYVQSILKRNNIQE